MCHKGNHKSATLWNGEFHLFRFRTCDYVTIDQSMTGERGNNYQVAYLEMIIFN